MKHPFMAGILFATLMFISAAGGAIGGYNFAKPKEIEFIDG